MTLLALSAYLLVAGAPAGAATGRDVAVTVSDERIRESSGLARSRAHPGVLWTVNDSGSGPQVYAVDAATGEVVGVHDFGAPVQDVEALAIGPDGRMYVADIGDNGASRPFVRVFWFPEPELGETSGDWASWELTYPDGPRDSETFMVAPDGRMVVVSKGSRGGVYALPAAPSRSGLNRMTRVGDAPRVVTDGTWLDDGQVVLRGYLELWAVDPQTWEVTDTGVPPPMRQGETVAAGAAPDTVVVGSEGVASRIVPAAVPGTGGVVAEPSPTVAEAPPTTDPLPPDGTVQAADTVQAPGAGGILLVATGAGVIALVIGAGVAAWVERSRRGARGLR